MCGVIGDGLDGNSESTQLAPGESEMIWTPTLLAHVMILNICGQVEAYGIITLAKCGAEENVPCTSFCSSQRATVIQRPCDVRRSN